MAITTLESHHRHNSVVIPEPVSCNLPHLPPPPYSQNPPLPGDGTDNLKVSRTMSRCPQTTKRLWLDAVDSERAFLNIRHAIFTPPLFSRNSRFPSRSLPPPGLRGCNLDAVDAKVFKASPLAGLRHNTLFLYSGDFSGRRQGARAPPQYRRGAVQLVRVATWRGGELYTHAGLCKPSISWRCISLV